MGKLTMWCLNRSDTNRAVQALKMTRGWKFWTEEEEKLYYPCIENKGSDQLRSYCEADQRLCFRIGKKNGFLMTRLKSVLQSNPVSLSVLQFNIIVNVHVSGVVSKLFYDGIYRGYLLF